MFDWRKKHHKGLLVLTDIMVLPGMLLCRWITDRMLATDNPCIWTRLGGQCVTCGGTHFVNDLCSFRIADAMQDNLLLFALTVFFAVSWVLLNLWLVFEIPFLKKILKKMYNIPTLIIWLGSMVLFFLIRNIPVFIGIWHMLFRT